MEAKGKLSFWDTGADGLGRLRALQACAQKWRHELESAPDAATLAAQLRCRWNFWREARGAKSPLAIKLELAFSFFCLVALFLFCLAGALLFVGAAIIGIFGEYALLLSLFFDVVLWLIIFLSAIIYGSKSLKKLSGEERERETTMRELSVLMYWYCGLMAAIGAVFLTKSIFDATDDSLYLSASASLYLSISAWFFLLCVFAFLYFYASGLCKAFVYMLFLKEIKPFSYLVYEQVALLAVSSILSFATIAFPTIKHLAITGSLAI